MLSSKGMGDIRLFIETIHNMDSKELLALTYHLFPASLAESKIKSEVLALIERFKGKGFVKGKKEGEKIIIEVDT